MAQGHRVEAHSFMEEATARKKMAVLKSVMNVFVIMEWVTMAPGLWLKLESK